MSFPLDSSVGPCDSLKKGIETEDPVSNVSTSAKSVTVNANLCISNEHENIRCPEKNIVAKNKCVMVAKKHFRECNLDTSYVKCDSIVCETQLSQAPQNSVSPRNKESHENFPFKDAVKDFVFNKFGKRLGTTDSLPVSSDVDKWTILSGIKGKISRTLDDKVGKDSAFGHEHSHEKLENSGLSVVYAPLELQAKIVKFKHSEIISKSECELKSVVANDVTESSLIEEARECFEGLKGSYIEPFPFKTSISEYVPDNNQPSSPLLERKLSSLSRSADISSPSQINKGKETKSFNSISNPECLCFDDLKESYKEISVCTDSVFETETSYDGSAQNNNDIKSFFEKLPFFDILKTWNEKKIYLLGFLCALCIIVPQFIGQLKSPVFAHISVVIFVFLVCWIWPISSFSVGFLNGVFFSTLAVHFYFFLINKSQSKKQLISPDYKSLAPPKVISSPTKKSNSFKGWMSKLKGKYDPEDVKIGNICSVYAQLDENYLRLCYPKNNIPRRAMWNEREHDMNFVRYTHHFLQGGKIMIVPQDLAKIRIWSKKYPLCLILPNVENNSDTSFKRNAGNTSINNLDADKNMKAKSLPNSLSGSPARHIDKSEESFIYLFARTDRDKEDWYWKFLHATQSDTGLLDNFKRDVRETNSLFTDFKLNKSSSVENIVFEPDPFSDDTENISVSCKENNFDTRKKKVILDFDLYMKKLLSCGKHDVQDILSVGNSSSELTSCSNVEWLNMLLGRLFYDFLTHEFWLIKVKDRIQNQLSRIKLPSYVAELQVTDIYLGNELPQLRRTSMPVMDNRGLWLDLDVEYSGGFQMTLETKFDLTSAKRSPSPGVSHTALHDGASMSHAKSSVGSINASDSSEDDAPGTFEHYSKRVSYKQESGRTSQKIFKAVEWCLHSRYFQNMTEFKYIRRAMEGVASTPIVLTVEVHGLVGTLAVNIPPLPTDRLWYGFRKNPELSLSAYPKLGAREISYAHITDLIEKQLLLEFQKILVMPNMDDILIPVMYSSVYDHQ